MMKYHFRRKGEKRLFKVCDKYYNDRVFTVYKVNKKGTMFLIYNYDVSEWQWVYSDSYIPIEDQYMKRKLDFVIYESDT